jgi:hypothetical protein
MKETLEEQSSIYRERDLLISLSTCSMLMLCQATTLGPSVVNELLESVCGYLFFDKLPWKFTEFN